LHVPDGRAIDDEFRKARPLIVVAGKLLYGQSESSSSLFTTFAQRAPH
jgi:hypothetical protein